MKKTILFVAGLAIFVAGCKSEEEAPPAPVSGATATGSVAFASVQTLFSKKCMPCHGDNPKEGIDLRTYDSVMKGGEHGNIVVAGDPENSVLLQALRGTDGKKQMPFKQPPLSEAEIKIVEDWMKGGAKA